MNAEMRGETMVTEPPMKQVGGDWQSSQLQLIVFPTEPAVLRDQEWWQQVTGQEPAQSTKKRLELISSGPWCDYTLVLTVDLARIIWTITPRIDTGQPPGEQLPTIGPYPSARDDFANLMMAWFTGPCPPIKRMALNGVLTQAAADHGEAYGLLQRYLSKVEIDPASTDFMYRVNRKRQSISGISDLSINRLSTWSAIKYSVSALIDRLGSQPSAQPIQVSPTTYAAFLQFDINTDAERESELPHDNLQPLFNELIDLAGEIASDGDIQ